MPNNTHKSAAVPFINNKGERSMKKVKVERYVAGKKPAYANDDDEDEYYITDEEVSDEEEEGEEEEENEDDRRSSDSEHLKPCTSGSSNARDDKGDDQHGAKPRLHHADEEDDEDDPRFRRLKQLESQAKPSRLLEVQARSEGNHHLNERNIVVEDDDEDEEDIRRRHAIARARVIEEPIGPQIILGDLADQQIDSKLQTSDYEDAQRSKRVDTDDILKDLVLTGIRPVAKALLAEEETTKAEEKFKDMIDQAKEEAIFTAQIHKKIEDDNKRELEKEALDKGGIGTYDMEAVKTDDEDDELAYEEWKVREIQRLLRDKSERAREIRAK